MLEGKSILSESVRGMLARPYPVELASGLAIVVVTTGIAAPVELCSLTFVACMARKMIGEIAVLDIDVDAWHGLRNGVESSGLRHGGSFGGWSRVKYEWLIDIPEKYV